MFDALLAHLNSFGLPPAVRRIIAEDRELNLDRVGYAVACRNAAGVTEVRLVTSLREVAELNIAEDAALSDAEIGPLRELLARLARQELDPTHAAADLEAINWEAGHSQLLLDWLVAQSLLRFRLQTGDPQERF